MFWMDNWCTTFWRKYGRFKTGREGNTVEELHHFITNFQQFLILLCFLLLDFTFPLFLSLLSLRSFLFSVHCSTCSLYYLLSSPFTRFTFFLCYPFFHSSTVPHLPSSFLYFIFNLPLALPFFSPPVPPSFHPLSLILNYFPRLSGRTQRWCNKERMEQCLDN